MAYTLRILFGGSLVLVDQPKGSLAGFYALFVSNTDIMHHNPMIRFRERYVKAGGGEHFVCQSLSADMIEPTPSFAGGTGQDQMDTPLRFVRPSDYKGAKVHAMHFQKTNPNINRTNTALQNIVKLPKLQRPLEPYGDFARVTVDNVKDPVWVAGFAKVEYDVDNGFEYLDVDGHHLTPKNGLLEIVFSNTPDKPMRPKRGELVAHEQAYYDLLENAAPASTPQTKGPQVKVDIASPDDSWINMDCPPLSGSGEVPPSNMSQFFIIPEECTVGIGNPPTGP